MGKNRQKQVNKKYLKTEARQTNIGKNIFVFMEQKEIKKRANWLERIQNIILKLPTIEVLYNKVNLDNMLLTKNYIKYFSSFTSVKQIPFQATNLLYLDHILSLKPSKSQLNHLLNEEINDLCPQIQKGKEQFEKSQKKVVNLYTYIKDNILKEKDPELDNNFHQRAHYYFEKEGKKVRPIMIELLAKNLVPHDHKQFHQHIEKWQALIEIMHIASLAHDDIIDNSPSRRGQESQHLKYGSKIAVFSGNYIISKASRTVSDFNSPRLYEIYAYAMDSLAQGEIIQLMAKQQNKFTHVKENKKKQFFPMIEKYMHKTYYKTAALMSNALVAIPTLLQISGIKQQISEQKCFRVGQHFGLAFQLVDDILDYISTSAEMGKEEMSDLIEGNVTAPVYFTYYHDENISKLGGGVNLQILNRRKKNKEEAMCVKKWVHEGVGLELTYLLAIRHIKEAFQILKSMGMDERGLQSWRYLGNRLVKRRK